MIEVSHLTKTFGRRTVVDDVSFRVEPGAVTGLLGPSGAGKTTTLKLIMGQERPTSGSALINGRQYSALEKPANTIGAMLDGQWMDPGRGAGHLRGINPTSIIPSQRVDQILDRAGLGRVARHRVRLRPTGLRRCLGVVAAVSGDPDHYVFDEPFMGLDPEDTRWMRQVLRRLAAQGKTVLVSGHSLTEMAHVADNLLVLGNGRLVADSTVDAFITSSGKPAVRVRAERQAELYDLLVSMGASVTPRFSDYGVTLHVDGLHIDQVADAAVNFGILELVEADAAMERTLQDVAGTGVPTVGTLVRGGIN